MTTYVYKITRREPCTIYVKPNWYYARWRRWGPAFSSPQAAQEALHRLRDMAEPLSEEDAEKVVLT